MNLLKSSAVFVIRIFVALLSASSAFALNDGAIIERKVYAFPSYEQAVQATDVEKYTDKVSYETAVNDARFEFEKLTYSSDGLKVIAYLYKPKENGRKFPTIIYNRGSAVRGDIAPELISFFHRVAAEGFVVLAPMLRQSDGGEGRDELGGADVDDLMNVLPLARSLAFVDMDNLFMCGESRGGMMTYQAIKRGFPVNAAAVVGAFTDMQAVIDTHAKQYPLIVLKQLWPDYELRRDEIARTRSAIFWADQLNVPLLIMHGGNDRSVNPEQSLALAEQLQKLDRVYELIVYAEDNHYLARNQEDRDRRAINWFKRYLKKSVVDPHQPATRDPRLMTYGRGKS
jgi:dipeptidyl aminopeptidase/acylaminoacyl peptidase